MRPDLASIALTTHILTSLLLLAPALAQEAQEDETGDAETVEQPESSQDPEGSEADPEEATLDLTGSRQPDGWSAVGEVDATSGSDPASSIGDPVLQDSDPEEVPTETIPTETIPTETLSAETIPDETLPNEDSLQEAVRTDPVPSETIPEEQVEDEEIPAPRQDSAVESGLDGEALAVATSSSDEEERTSLAGGGAEAQALGAPEQFFDLERLMTRIPDYEMEMLVVEDGLAVGVATLESRPMDDGKRLIVWEERVQPGRGLGLDVTIRKRVLHDTLGRAERSEMERWRKGERQSARAWSRMGAGRTKVEVLAAGEGVDPMYDQLVEAGVTPECTEVGCLATGLIAGGGVLPDVSVLGILVGQLPNDAWWEGWTVSLDDGEPVLTQLEVVGQRVIEGPNGETRFATSTKLSAGAESWEVVHDDGELLAMNLPGDRRLVPLRMPAETVEKALEDRAAARRHALEFLLAWREGRWTEASQHAEFVDPNTIRDWKQALGSWNIASLSDTRRGLARRVVDARPEALDGGGWRFVLPLDAQGRRNLAVDVTESGAGTLVSSVLLLEE